MTFRKRTNNQFHENQVHVIAVMHFTVSLEFTVVFSYVGKTIENFRKSLVMSG